MMSLFSSFDIMPFFWFSYMFLIFMSFYFFNANISSFKDFSSKEINKFFQMFFYNMKNTGMSKCFTMLSFSLFMYLLMSNYGSVLPFNFAVNSQISIVFFISLTIWSSFFLYTLTKNLNYLISHCIPEGTPIMLVLFLFLIEIVSQLIRPLTLSVRLMANILAGHLLMILLSKISLYSFMGVLPYMLLNLVEMFVSLIQSYIMVTMVCLYYAEIN